MCIFYIFCAFCMTDEITFKQIRFRFMTAIYSYCTNEHIYMTGTVDLQFEWVEVKNLGPKINPK